MSYLPDYITWRGDLPFAADPANDLDTLVMAALSYIDLPAERKSSPSARNLFRRTIRTTISGASAADCFSKSRKAAALGH